MATLISYSSGGGDKGRCDGKCYNARHPKCDCICGGANHGVGINVAVQNTLRLADKWVEKYNAEHPGAKIEVRQNWDKLRQHLSGDLFA
jgi:hypothetical protein